jgi:hypothetical protein
LSFSKQLFPILKVHMSFTNISMHIFRFFIKTLFSFSKLHTFFIWTPKQTSHPQPLMLNS